MDLNALRLKPEDVAHIAHPPDYIKSDSLRRIFYDVEFHPEETQAIEDLKRLLYKQGVQLNYE